MADNLSPCPFCGGEPHLMHCGVATYMVQCLQCKATTDDGCLDRVSANWNRRDMFDDLRQIIMAKAVEVQTDFQRGHQGAFDCSTSNGALHYGRRQGLELAAEMISPKASDDHAKAIGGGDA